MSVTSMPETPNGHHQQDNQPAHDSAAEQAVLGAAMLSTEALGDLAEHLPTADLYRPAHQAIYRVCLDLYAEGSPVDPITVGNALHQRGELGRIGGAPYLHTCTATVTTATNVGYYAEIVSTTAQVRRMSETGTYIGQLAAWAAADGAIAPTVPDLVNRAQQALDQVAGDSTTDDGAGRFAELVQPALDQAHAIETGADDTGIPTGFADLDALTGGLRPGQLVTIAARPGMGKSALAGDFARHVAIRLGKGAAIFSLEMGKQEIMMRMLSAEAKVRLQDLRGGHMSEDDWMRLARKVGELGDPPLYLDDTPGMTITNIRAKARRWKQRHDLRLIVVDYLQLMTSGQRSESRQVEVSEFSRQLKLLAKELDVPVVALSQLNRGPEQRTDKRPLLSDLRESGSIEQDSDIVLLLDRPDTRERDDPRAGEADLILAKHRDGPISTVAVAHQLHYSRFADLASDEN